MAQHDYSRTDFIQLATERSSKVVIVVDPYSTGKTLVEELKKQTLKVVAVQSSLDLADFWLQQLEKPAYRQDFEEVKLLGTVADDDLTAESQKRIEQDLQAAQTEMERDEIKLAEYLRSRYKIGSVIAGSEPGVILTENLQTLLDMPARNGETTKMARRHKFDMQERLRKQGVRAIRQIFASDADEALDWVATENKGKWPIIVKPACSGGTDGVYWCHNADDVRTAFNMECGKVNVNGAFNDKLLAQEFLEGVEYIVDGMSYDGKHVIAGIWQYYKYYDPIKKAISHDHARLQKAKGKVQDQLVKYYMQALDALEFKFGPSHGEIIMCDDGPCLVEVGARMHGCNGAKATEMATGLGLHEWVADIYVNGGQIHSQHYENMVEEANGGLLRATYTVKQCTVEGMLNNQVSDGYLLKDLDEDGTIKNLPSCEFFNPGRSKGDKVTITRDCASAPGTFVLTHASEAQCLADLQVMRMLERDPQGMYAVSDTPLPGTDLKQINSVSTIECVTTPKTPVSDDGSTTLAASSFGLNTLTLNSIVEGKAGSVNDGLYEPVAAVL